MPLLAESELHMVILRLRAAPLVLAATMLLPALAQAQQSTEERMRDALRQAVTEMRAAQDQAAQAQADLARAQGEKSALQAQLDAANAKLAGQAARPAARPADEAAMQARVRAAEAQAAALQQRSVALQGSVQAQAALARTSQEESQQAAAALRGQSTALTTCKAANAKLTDVAEQILHLYESQSFRAVLLRSYEPILGEARVRLENTVQTYDDKIRDQEYVAPGPAAAAPAR